MLPPLPMDVWARVAVFVPFAERLSSFHALRACGLLPDTYTTPSNMLLQFCAQADDAVADTPEWWVVEQFLAMGFSHDQILNAHMQCDGDVMWMVGWLIERL